MTANPEQPVLDEIAALVDWQLEEGRKRGDGPAHGRDGVYEMIAAATPEQLAAVTAWLNDSRFRQRYHLPPAWLEPDVGTPQPALEIGWLRSAPEPEPSEVFVGEIYTPGGDNSNPETIRIERGDRVGWQGLDGVVHPVVVDDFTVSPSGEWTFTTSPTE